MKKTVPLLLLLVLLFSVSGHFISFKVIQHSIKKEIKKKIKRSVPEIELSVFTFSKAELAGIDWEEKGKEFWREGNMYDVVRKVETVDCVTFYCINDTQEKTLFANLDDLINRQMNSETQGNNSSVKKLSTDYFFTAVSIKLTAENYCSSTIPEQQKLFRGFSSEKLQPPELV